MANSVQQRSSEATLAPSFASLQLKKLELEFAVDPLFKKASADFDEGGAKGLLLNHLMIDGQGRIVFDSSDDANDVAKPRKSEVAEMEGTEEADEEDEIEKEVTAQLQGEGPVETEEEDVEIDIASLGARFFPDLGRLDELDVCPSLKTFTLGDPSGSMDIPFLNASEDWRHDNDKDKNDANAVGDKSGMLIDEDNPLGFDDMDDGLGAFGLGADVNFGEGGEAWAREAALAPQMRVFDGGLGEGGIDVDGVDMLDNVNGDYVVSMSHAQNPDKMHEDILSYFDQALQKNWTSAEHWRIRKIKDVNKPAALARPRKEKEVFEIDFASALDPAIAETLYAQASSTSAISLPKKDWKSKSRNLLPDDKHFNSKQLLSLFLKPKARMGRRRQLGGRLGNAHLDGAAPPAGEMDEAFWASQKAPQQADGGGLDGPDGDHTALPAGDYDANFFADDGLPFAAGGLDDDDGDDDMDEFADAREHFGPRGDDGAAQTVDMGATGAFGGLTVTNPADLAFGTMLVTQGGRRARPEYVQYARVAKKVDVRRLKEEMWKGMALDKLAESVRAWPLPASPSLHHHGELTSFRQESQRSRLPTPPADVAGGHGETDDGRGAAAPDLELRFTDVMNNLQMVYPKPVMDDISTSYCFISLLHLANEKGLHITKTAELTELNIRKDWTAEVEVGGE